MSLLINSAGVRIVPRAHRNRDCAGLGGGDFRLRRGGGDLGGGSNAGEGEDDDERTDYILHMDYS